MAVTKKIKVSTWNMQKGPGMESMVKSNIFDAAARSARYQVLEYLKTESDITFIQESPADIREVSQTIDYSGFKTQDNAWVSYVHDSDNQDNKSANRPSYWSKFPAMWTEVPSDCPVNGKQDSFRLSAIAYACTPVGYEFFISLHATSGGHAKRNTQSFIEWICKWLKAKEKNAAFALIGADFNHSVPDGVHQASDCQYSFNAPNAMTQQSDGIIDGFCCIIANPAIDVKWWPASRLCTGERDAPIETKMVMVDPNIHQGVNERGYLGKIKTGQLPGTVQDMKGKDMWVRMSDHCPVLCEIDLTWA